MERLSEVPILSLGKLSTPVNSLESISNKLVDNFLQHQPIGRRRWLEQELLNQNLCATDFENTNQLQTEIDRKPAADHEIGHAIVAQGSDFQTGEINVIPQGSTLGYTKVFGGDMSSASGILRWIRVLVAGRVGEEFCGHTDHSGCGSDFARAKYMAQVYVLYFQKGIGSVEQILSQEMSHARNLIGMSGFRFFNQYAWRLTRAGTI